MTAAQAAAVMQARLPVGVTEAKAMGLIDDHFGRAPGDVPGRRDRAGAGARGGPGFAAALADRNVRRAADEAAKPLAAYRAEELDRMKLNFYGFDSSYHVARWHFVHKSPARAPPCGWRGTGCDRRSRRAGCNGLGPGVPAPDAAPEASRRSRSHNNRCRRSPESPCPVNRWACPALQSHRSGARRRRCVSPPGPPGLTGSRSVNMKSMLIAAAALAAMTMAGAANAATAEDATKGGCMTCHAVDTKKMGPVVQGRRGEVQGQGRRAGEPGEDAVRRQGSPEGEADGRRARRHRQVGAVELTAAASRNEKAGHVAGFFLGGGRDAQLPRTPAAPPAARSALRDRDLPGLVDRHVDLHEADVVAGGLELVVRHFGAHARRAVRNDPLVLRNLAHAGREVLVGNQLRALDHAGVRLVLVAHVEDQHVGRRVGGEREELGDRDLAGTPLWRVQAIFVAGVPVATL